MNKFNMSIEEVMSWIQDNGAIVRVLQGAEAIQTIVENGGRDIFNDVKFIDGEDQGLEGYWVEIALNDDCAGWDYRARLVDALHGAFEAMVEFARDRNYIENGNLKLVDRSNDKYAGKSWIGQRHYNFVTDEIEYVNLRLLFKETIIPRH